MFWYRNVAVFLLTVLAPFFALIYWNSITITLLRRRTSSALASTAAMMRRREVAGIARNGETSRSFVQQQQQSVKAEENTAHILFALTLLFFLCNSLR